MSTRQERDAEMDRLLRAVLKPASREAAGECPDAAFLAAMVEGSLTPAEQSALDTHIVNCGRCQEALAILSRELPEEEAAPETRWFTWVTRPRLRWFVPIGAAATVAVVFFATRPLIAPEGQVPAAEVAQMAQAPSAPAAVPADELDVRREKSVSVQGKSEFAGAPERRDSAKPQAGQPAPAKPAADTSADARMPAAAPAGLRTPVEPAAEMMAARVTTEEKLTQPAVAPPAPPAATGQPATAPQAAGVPVSADAARKQAAASRTMGARNLLTGPVMVSAPGGTVLWRFGAGGYLSRSGDAGDTWHEQPSGVTADLLAGAAPSPAACWIVGTAGTVLLTTDGERWERRPFPFGVDLVAVEASSSLAATVTTRDGRRYETLDAGLTWSPKQ